MGYLEIVAIVFLCMNVVFSVFTLHYPIFMLIGLFGCKKFPHTADKKRYAIVIGARNEEKVITHLIDSVFSSNYPKEKIAVFVVAHNCTDKTAEVSRAHGAIVYEYDNPAENTVGYAYKYLFDMINRDHKGEFDGFFVINADNVLTPDYIDRMNDAFVYYDGKRVVTSYRNSGNIADNFISCMYGMYFVSACRFEARGRTVCDCSTRVSGTGYVMPASTVENGWEYVTLTEDWEFTADRVCRGQKIMHCDEAEFFDEQPTTVPVMMRQRLRWARGHTLVFLTRFRKLVRSFFKRKKRGGNDNKFSIYDTAVSIMPLGAIGVGLWIAQTALIALCPIFGYDAARVWAVYGMISAILFGAAYLLTFMSGMLLVIIERKRLLKVPFGKKFAALLLFPFFLLINVVLDVASLFAKKLSWKTIPHNGQSIK